MLSGFRKFPWRETLPYVVVIVAAVALASFLAHCEPIRSTAYAPVYQEEDELCGMSAADWTAIFTGLLTFSTIGLWWVTLIAAKAAEKGADVAERTLTDLETPFLYPVVKSDDTRESFKLFVLYDHPNSPQDDQCTPGVSFRVKNFGRTPALLRSVAVEFEHWSEMVEAPRYDPLADYAVEPILEAHRETAKTFKKYVAIPIDKDAFNSIKAGHGRLFLHGEFVFADVFGADYAQTFCLAWDWRSKGFIPWDARYNKRKRKDPEEK